MTLQFLQTFHFLTVFPFAGNEAHLGDAFLMCEALGLFPSIKQTWFPHMHL